jgi:branched-chain amino acid transport system ATP-binding protein
LEARNLSAGYGSVPVLHEINLKVEAGEIVTLIGPNGAGKTTTLLALSGALSATGGTVLWRGTETRSPLHRRCQTGMAFVPQERSIFASLSTEANLKLGRGGVERAVELMPELHPLLKRKAGLLSGGEQQMLVLARALASEPELLLADEVSLGLAPQPIARLMAAIRSAVETKGIGVLLVEQHVDQALAVADRAYVLRRGEVILEAPAAKLRSRLTEVQRAYLT